MNCENEKSWGRAWKCPRWVWDAWACRTSTARRDEAEAIATIHRALDLGINFLDTADAYGSGRNEELVGRAIRGQRHKVIVATKLGNVRNPDGTFKGVNGKPDYVRQCCDAEPRSVLAWR